MSDPAGPALTLQQLPDLRRKTDTVAKFLKEQISVHLETLRPLFAPDRVFGKYAGGKVDVQGAERGLNELQQKYRPFSTKPFDLPTTFDTNWLGLVGTGLEAQSWEYIAQIQGQNITVTSPVKWVLSYRSAPSPSHVPALVSGGESSRRDDLRQSVINSLVLQLVIQRNPGINQLFRDLRFELAHEPLPGMAGFSVVTITSCLSSFRPADDLVAAATAFSGIPSFIELIDTASIQQPRDLLREKLEELTK
jgi:hypothetical protein